MERVFTITIKDNNIKCDEIKADADNVQYRTTEKNDNHSNKRVTNLNGLIEKYIFPLMCLAYLILMSVGVINPKHPLALFMGGIFALFSNLLF